MLETSSFDIITTTSFPIGPGNHDEGNEAQASDALDLSLPTPRINVIDCSMSNALLPGHLGGVSCFQNSQPPLLEMGREIT
jgi:hypothetical protein